MALPETMGLTDPLHLGTDPHHATPPSCESFGAEHDHAQKQQNQDQSRGGRDVERHLGLGEDLGRERLVTEDLECSVLGQHDQRHQKAASEDGATCLADGDAEECAHPTHPQAAGDVLLLWIGDPQTGSNG